MKYALFLLEFILGYLLQAQKRDRIDPPYWWTSFVKMYEGLASDFHYSKPNDIMVFPDNQNMDRIYTQFKEDIPIKMALNYILTLPRISQKYYRT
jgi:hypothetical protein